MTYLLLVVLDYRMPEMDGLAVAIAIREHHGHIAVLLLTGYPRELLKELLDIVDASVTKGQSPDLLLGELRRLTGGAKKPPATDIAAGTRAALTTGHERQELKLGETAKQWRERSDEVVVSATPRKVTAHQTGTCLASLELSS